MTDPVTIRSIPEKIQIITISVAIVILLVLGAILSGVSSTPIQVGVGAPAPVETPITPHQIQGVKATLQDTLMAGCETHACTSLLRSLGYDINEFQFADKYLDCHAVTEDPETGIKLGPDMNSGFAGTAYAGYGIYAPAMAKCMNRYLADVKSDKKAYVLEDYTLQKLCDEYIVNDVPVMIWATTNMTEPQEWEAWKVNYVDENAKYKEGEIFKWMLHEHCLVLCGYDQKDYYFSDSVVGDISHFERKISERRFEQLGRQAIVVK